MKEEYIKVPAEVRELVQVRDKVRQKGLWAEADVLRQRIRDLGFKVEDIQDGGVRITKA